MKRCPYDLHLHTWWSYDALVSVEDVFRIAGEKQVTTIAVADHHVIDGFADAKAASAECGINWIPSAELSVTTSAAGGVDLVCLGLPLEPEGALAEVLDEYHEWQRFRGQWSIEGMIALGHEFSQEKQDEMLASYRPEKAVAAQGRTHLKNQLFRSYLKSEGIIAADDGYWPFREKMREAVGPPPEYPAVGRVAPAVKAAGGLVVIAHPAGYFKGHDEAQMDALKEECLLDGIECAHASVPADLTPLYREYCVKHGLVSTGGSDGHTVEGITKNIGGHGGDPEWLDEVLERMS